MMDDFIGTYGNNLIVAVVGVGVALLALAIVLWLVRRRGGSSPFIRGGKNRQPRLQVLDATAVDARRRLVLVRRDNVEHLVMIGGPTDVVIESGIGAIPILRDVRDPQEAMLQSLSSERALASGRVKALSPDRDQEVRPAPTMTASAPAPQPEPRPVAAPVAAPAPASAPSPAPAPASPPPVPAPTMAPRQAAPVAPPQRPRPEPVAPPAPAQASVRPAPSAPQASASFAPPARSFSKEASTLDISPIVPAVTAASLQAETARPVQTVSVEQSEPAAVAPPSPSAALEPVAIKEPVIDESSAADFLAAARERVLPTFRTETPVTATASAAKPEPLAPDVNGAVFGDQLTSDFESFLQAEIEKNNTASAPSVSLEPAHQQIVPEPVAPAVATAPSDADVQKEMARIFGEMAVTRDK